jgi:IS30 family transposase
VNASELETAIRSEEPQEALRAVSALRHLADQLERRAVRAAREQGWSWTLIGDALGVSRQAMHKKYRRDAR